MYNETRKLQILLVIHINRAVVKKLCNFIIFNINSMIFINCCSFHFFRITIALTTFIYLFIYSFIYCTRNTFSISFLIVIFNLGLGQPFVTIVCLCVRMRSCNAPLDCGEWRQGSVADISVQESHNALRQGGKGFPCENKKKWSG